MEIARSWHSVNHFCSKKLKLLLNHIHVPDGQKAFMFKYGCLYMITTLKSSDFIFAEYFLTLEQL